MAYEKGDGKTVVIALGGNALGNTPQEQLELVQNTAKHIVDMIEEGTNVVVSHGNGPQVGMINNAFAYAAANDDKTPDMPFPEAGAMSQGYIGYQLSQAILNDVKSREIPRSTACIVTQTVVDAGIKLVVYDRLIENFDGLEGQMMGDNFSIGREMGEYLTTYFADSEKVNYLRFVGDSSTVTSQRSGGMDEVIDAAKFNQINETFVTDWSTEKAQEQMENWLNAHTNEEIESLDLIVTHDDEIVDGLMNALEAYSGSATLNVKLITSVGGREDTMQKFENSSLDVKFITWFFAPSFIRECVDFTVESAMGLPFSGTALEENGIYLIPSFSIGNAGEAHYDFDQYRASSEYEVRYSIGNF